MGGRMEQIREELRGDEDREEAEMVENREEEGGGREKERGKVERKGDERIEEQGWREEDRIEDM